MGPQNLRWPRVPRSLNSSLRVRSCVVGVQAKRVDSLCHSRHLAAGAVKSHVLTKSCCWPRGVPRNLPGKTMFAPERSFTVKTCVLRKHARGMCVACESNCWSFHLETVAAFPLSLKVSFDVPFEEKFYENESTSVSNRGFNVHFSCPLFSVKHSVSVRRNFQFWLSQLVLCDLFTSLEVVCFLWFVSAIQRSIC